MIKALLIAANDLRRRRRDRSALITAFVAPIALASIMGLAFGGPKGGAFVRIAVADDDRTPTSRALLESALETLAAPPEVGIDRVSSGSEAARRVTAGQDAAGLVLLQGFSTEIGKRGPNPIWTFAGGNGQIGSQVAFGLRQAIYGRYQTGQLAAAVSGRDVAEALVRSSGPPVGFASDRQPPRKSLIGYFGPAMAIIFIFLGAGAGARSILTERQTGTLARLQAAPVRRASILGGKIGAIVAVALTSILAVWVTTTAAFGASWGPPAGVVVLSVATVLSFSAIALLVTVLARSEAQADTATTITVFTLALLGGNFFPPGTLPPLFEKVTLLTPNGWALQGFGSMAIDGKGIGSIVGPLVVLGMVSAAFGGVALLRLRKVPLI